MRASWLIPSLVAVLGSVGCASTPPSPDDLGETGEDSAELRLASNSGFFVVTRHDNRRCVSPLCGGFFVRRVNAQSSRCGDGSYASECYVSELDLSAIGVTGQEADDFLAAAQDGKAALRGGFEGFDWNGHRLHKLAASEGWKAAGGTPVAQLVGSTGYRLTSTGIMCITSPCPSFKEATLNGSSSRRIHDVDWGTNAPQELFSQALDALSTKDGVLVAGNNTSFRGPGGVGTRLLASEFYLKVTPTVAPPPPPQTGRACGSRGQGPCATGQYCDFPESAACGIWDAGGTCQIAPQICAKIYKPVCGCDGQTYGNDCMARSASTSIKSQGECP